MTITIVEADLATPRHREAVPALINNYAGDPMGGNQELDERTLERMVSGLAAHPSSLIFLAFDGDQPVGIANCFVGFSTFAARPLINIHDLAVIPEYRGKGIGERLINAVEEKAREMGCCKLTLEVREDNPARRLYERTGFADFTTGEEKVRTYFLEKKVES